MAIMRSGEVRECASGGRELGRECSELVFPKSLGCHRATESYAVVKIGYSSSVRICGLGITEN
jgi:hypothetical protein